VDPAGIEPATSAVQGQRHESTELRQQLDTVVKLWNHKFNGCGQLPSFVGVLLPICVQPGWLPSDTRAGAGDRPAAAHVTSAPRSASSVHIGPVIDVEDVNHMPRRVDSVHNAIRTAPSTAATRQRAEQGLAHTVRVQRERPSADLQDRRCHGLG
jgi:hypothetical protein